MKIPRDQMEALQRLMAAQFRAIELHLFLDTHPDNAQALGDYARACQQLQLDRQNYSSRYGPVFPCDPEAAGTMFQWINQPWPWEIDYC